MSGNANDHDVKISMLTRRNQELWDAITSVRAQIDAINKRLDAVAFENLNMNVNAVMEKLDILQEDVSNLKRR